jgi:hypothetical protein
MCKASDEELAVLCAMNDDEEEQYVEACRQFEKLRSIAKKTSFRVAASPREAL